MKFKTSILCRSNLIVNIDNQRQIGHVVEEKKAEQHDNSNLDEVVNDEEYKIEIHQVSHQVQKHIHDHLFQQASFQVELDANFVNDVIASHKKSKVMKRTGFFNHLRHLSKIYQIVALNNCNFLQLTKTDQRKLLARNSALFIQFVLAKYLCTKKGAEQIQWFLGYNCPPKLPSKLKPLSYRRFNRHVKLFHNQDDYITYKSLMNETVDKSGECIGLDFLGLWCHVTLFQYDATMRFDEPTKVHYFCERIMSEGEDIMANYQIDFPQTIVNCEALARFFADTVSWSLEPTSDMDDESSNTSSASSSLSTTCLTLAYSREEDLWLTNQLKMYDRTWSSVNIGESVLKECMYFALSGDPLSKRFLTVASGIVNEKLKLVVKVHPEFNSIGQAAQQRLWKMNLLKGFAMIAPWMEHYTSILDQLLFAGSPDDKFYIMSVSKSVGKTDLGPGITFTDMIRELGFTNEIIRNFNALLGRLNYLVHSEDIYKSFVLILLFSSCDDIPIIAQLRNNYMNAVRRKYNQIKDNFGDNLLMKFQKSFEDVDQLCMIFGQFLQHP